MSWFDRWFEDDDANLTTVERIEGMRNHIEILRERIECLECKLDLCKGRIKGLIETRNNQRYEINRLNCIINRDN